MRNNLQSNPIAFKIIILLTCFMLVMLYNKSKAGELPPSTFKKVAVTFRQDLAKSELMILLKSSADKAVKLYIFSADGKLLKETFINNKQETVVKDLKRGMYLYECFDNELEVKSGKLILK